MSETETNNSERQNGGEKSVSPQAGRDYIDSRTREAESKLARFIDSGAPIAGGLAGIAGAELIFLRFAESMPDNIKIGGALLIAGLSIGYLQLALDKARQDLIKRRQQKGHQNG